MAKRTITKAIVISHGYTTADGYQATKFTAIKVVNGKEEYRADFASPAHCYYCAMDMVRGKNTNVITDRSSADTFEYYGCTIEGEFTIVNFNTMFDIIQQAI